MSHRLNMRELSVVEAQGVIDEFRRNRVAYVIDLHSLSQFPPSVRGFLYDNYQWYYGSLAIVGFAIQPEPKPMQVEVFVPGTYRWAPSSQKSAAVLLVDGTVIRPHGQAVLSAGTHRLVTIPGGTGGTLVLALGSRPDKGMYSFIDHRQLRRLYGAE